MIDIGLIRNSRELVRESERKRFRTDTAVVDRIYDLDQKRIKLRFRLDNLNGKRNRMQAEIKTIFKGNKAGGREEARGHINEIEDMGKEISGLESEVAETEEEINRLLKGIGNILAEEVLESRDEAENPVISTFRASRRAPEDPKSFDKLMERYTHMEAACEIVGHRGYYLSGRMAKLAQALTRYAIDFLENRQYTYIQTPVLLRREPMSKVAQLSDFDEMLYKVEDDLYLIATSEQSLAALYMGKRLVSQDLPIRFCGQSLCFRKEAGAAGKDNAGLFRVHQFEKIEQFVLCSPGDSSGIHSEMMSVCEEFYRSLDISYRVVSIVSGELNDAAAIKYDLEAYFPHSDRYRELVSCSNCTDYQARELEVRYGIVKDDNKKMYVHMLNG
jgi:seryl-tRNA synthetase